MPEWQIARVHRKEGALEAGCAIRRLGFKRVANLRRRTRQSGTGTGLTIGGCALGRVRHTQTRL